MYRRACDQFLVVDVAAVLAQTGGSALSKKPQ
jgi:hypothetical protein